MVTVTNGREIMALRERLDRELGIPLEKEDVLERWQRLKPQPEPERPEPKLDIRPPTMAEIDDLIGQRIAAQHEFTICIMAEVIANPEEWMPAAPPGPPGPPGSPGPAGAPGKLPIVKLWQPDSVTYEAQVVSYDGATYQASEVDGEVGPEPTKASISGFTPRSDRSASPVVAPMQPDRR